MGDFKDIDKSFFIKHRNDGLCFSNKEVIVNQIIIYDKLNNKIKHIDVYLKVDNEEDIQLKEIILNKFIDINTTDDNDI